MYQDRSRNGYGIGKAYSAGEGYNVFRTITDNGYAFPRSGRFTTHIGASLIDGRPALLMDYTTFNNQPGRTGLVDEIRRLSPGLYLGTATQPKPDGTRTDAGGCFLLNGPVSPWHGVDDPTREP
jgi:hypothetical protein